MKYSDSIWVRTLTCSLLVVVWLLIARVPAWAKVEENTIHCSVMSVEGNWKIYGDIPDQALLISLQGLVNRTGPRLYLLYGPNYAWTEVQALLDFYHEKRHVDYTKIDSIPEALQKFRKYVKGYIVYD